MLLKLQVNWNFIAKQKCPSPSPEVKLFKKNHQFLLLLPLLPTLFEYENHFIIKLWWNAINLRFGYVWNWISKMFPSQRKFTRPRELEESNEEAKRQAQTNINRKRIRMIADCVKSDATADWFELHGNKLVCIWSLIIIWYPHCKSTKECMRCVYAAAAAGFVRLFRFAFHLRFSTKIFRVHHPFYSCIRF